MRSLDTVRRDVPHRFGRVTLAFMALIAPAIVAITVGLDADTANAARTPGELVRYDFSEGGGTTVGDTGSGTPMNLTIANPANVAWGPDGLTVTASTKISSGGPATKLIDAIKTSGAFTLEAWVTPAAGIQSGPARIMSNSPDAFSRNFLLGQGAYSKLPNDVFSLRSRTSSSIGGTPELFTATGEAVPEQLTHVVATRNASGVRTIYVDGVAVGSDTLGGNLSNWNTSFPFTLANVDAGNRPWLGTFCQVAVYDFALSSVQVGDNYQVGCGVPTTPNNDPTIDDVADRTDAEGGVVSVQVTGQDVDGDSLLYSAQNLPAGVSINSSTGLISGTIGQTAANASPYGVTVSVADGRGGSASDTFTWTVDAVNVDPVLVGFGDQSSSEGQNVSLGLLGSDADGDPLTYTATGLPTGLGINPTTGLISGMVAAGAAAGSPYAVQVDVTDGQGGSASLAFSWTVGIVTGPTPIVQYEFQEGSGSTVADTGSGTPLNLTIQNPGNVTWMPGGGLTINSTTMISSAQSSKVTNAVAASGAFTVEAWIAPAVGTQSGPARIVENGPDPLARNFMLGQGAYGKLPNSVFSLRSRTSTNTSGTPELFSATGVTTTDLTHVVASRSASGARSLYVNGVLSSSDNLGGATTNWNAAFPLVLGNTGNGTRGWLGSFCRVAIYDAALTAGEVSSNYADGCGESAQPNNDPVLAPIGPQASSEGDAPTLVVAATDDDAGDTLTYSASGLPIGLSINPSTGLISGVISQTAATGSPYSVTVTVDDGNGGTDGETFEWTVAAVNVDPVLDPIGDQQSEAGAVVGLTATASDDDDDSLSFSAIGLPTGLNMDSGGEISGTIDAGIANGTVFGVTVTVDDGNGGSDSESFNWTIAANTPPAFDVPLPPDQSSDEGDVVSLAFPATDPDDDVIAYSATGLPDGLNMNVVSGVVTGTIDQNAAQNSPYSSTVNVVDGRGGSDEYSFTWTVAEVNLDPTLDPIGDQANDEGDAVSIDLDATDLDGDGLTFGATNLPPSLTIDPVTGEVTGTIDAGASGGSPYSVEFTVTDGNGGSDSETITWDVSVFTGPDPLVHYEFEEGSGTTVSDSGLGAPLDLVIADAANVTWIPGGGLTVDAVTTISSAGGAAKVVDAVKASGEFTVEAWVRSELADQEGPARLVSNSPDPFTRNFMLGQGGYGKLPNDVYSLRSRTQTSTSGTPELFTATGNAQLGKLTHVVASRDSAGNRTIYVDGVAVGSDVLTGGVANWDAGFPLTLANIPTGNRGWIGTFCEVAIYDTALTPADVAANYGAGCDLPAAPAEALVQITPGGGIGATTFGNQTITVTNNGGVNAPQITKVEFDLRGSLIPDATFDPIGTAGDEGTQCLQVSQEGGTGYVLPADNCTDPFSLPHEDDPGVPGNGWDGMTLDFTDFGTGESIVFGVDVDPTTIQGVPGSGGAGAISGLELTGSIVTVTFSDGQVLSNQLFGDGSAGGGQAVVAAALGTTVPTGIELVGVAATPTVFPNNSKVAQVDGVGPQTVVVTGPVGASVTLLVGDGELQSPAPFDPDPFEVDALVAVEYLTGVIGAGGSVEFPVGIDSAAVQYHFVASIDDGAHGPLTEQLIVVVDSPAGALVQVTPNEGIGASTFTNGTMSITNTGGAGDPEIASVVFDLRGSILPDATFDPNGVAGDTTPKCLVISSGAASTGYQTPADNCYDPFSVPHEDEPGVPGNGFDVMTLDFDDFGPGESISFAVDIDVTSIQGVVGSGGAGAVSGLELTGSLITVVFDDGSTQTAAYSQIFGDGSAGGGIAVVDSTTAVLSPPAIEVVGVTTTPTVFTNGSVVGSVPATGAQTVRISGTPGDAVTLLQMTGDFVTDPAFDVDDFESDAAVAVAYFNGVIGAGGSVDIPVDIASTDVLYHFTAIVGDGSSGASTQILIGVGLDLDAPVIDPIADVVVTAGDVIAIPIASTSPVAEAITLSLASTPDIEISGAVFTDVGDGTGSIDWNTDLADIGTYDVTVTATTASGASSESFSIVVTDPDGGTVLYRVNAGGPEIADPNGGPAWTEDRPTAGAGGVATVGTPSPYLLASSNTSYAVADTIDLSHPTVPTGTPQALFQTERYDSGPATPMVYEFPVGAGQAYEVDLYFAELYATAADFREFTVNVEGTDFLVDYDIYEQFGGLAGVVETISTPVVADDYLTITFSHVIENPKIGAIEVRTAGPPPVDVPPLIDPIADTSATVGATVIVPIGTTEFDGDIVTLGYSSVPDASSFTALVDNGDGTGTLTFQPVGGDAGTYTVTVTATDKDGTDTEVFDLQVFDPVNVFARINAGGPLVPSIDAGPDWEADTTASNHPYLANPGSNGNSGGTAVEPNASVPAYVPGAVVDTERWSNSGFGYDIPVPAGTQVYVRLFLGNNYGPTSTVGTRVFDISIDGVLVEDDLDLIVEYGHQLAGMREYLITSDGTVDIEFSNVVENPLVNAIEVATAESSPDSLGATPTAVDFGITLTGGSANETVMLTNLGFEVGDPTITVTGVTVNGGGEFTTDFSGPVDLTAGASDTFDVTFSPTANGDQSGSLSIAHSGVNSPLVVTLFGEASNDIPVSFSQTGLSGETSTNPTSLEFGPDGRLYVAQQDATIKAYTVVRNSATDYQVTATETINLVKTGTPNHNDDGAANGTSQRQVTGLLVTGTPSAPVLYVTSSDWRISVGNDSGLDTNSGVLSRLTWNGSSWDKVDLVRGLPRSEENHSTNGMDLDESTNTLYLMQGGHANKGAPGNNFSGTPEYYLSAAMLTVDLDAIDALGTFIDPRNGAEVAYDLRTLNDPSRADITNTDPNFPYPVGHPLYDVAIDVGDPFGGNNGLNQAIPEPGGPVQIYSPGYRNAYDVVFTSQGRLYTSDNGPNGGWGGVPLSYTAAGAPIATGSGPYTLSPGDYCTNEFNDANSTGHGDPLHFVDGAGYYGGHPAPIRAFPELSRVIVYTETTGWNETANYNFFDLLPPGISSTDFPDDPIQCDYTSNDPGKYLDIVNASTNGIAEYTATNFGGKLQGNILTASFNGSIYSYDLNAAGDSVDTKTTLFSGFGSQPLDVIAQGDSDPFPGTVWAAAYGADTIVVFEPSDSTTCTGAYDIGLDEDADGFTNADEIDAGTDPCSGGDQPTDNDGDFISDFNDPDDDNDGIPDIDDEFALDPDNGLTTSIPVLRPFENNDPGTFFFGLGLSGLMTNGTTDYLDQFDPANLAAGGNGGELGVENITPGDAYQAGNSQENAFQYGVDADTSTDPFVVTTEVAAPMFGGATPANFQSMGLQIGAGDQDNYLKVVVAANGGAGGVEVLLEVAGVATQATTYGTTEIGTSVLAATAGVELSLVVDPAALTAQPRIRVDGGTAVDLGAPVTIPASWLDPSDENGLAVGVISTSNGATPFDALWSYLDVTFLAGTNAAPTVTPVADQSVAEGDPLVVQVVADDADGDTLSYALSGDVPAGMAIDTTGEITWTPDLDDSGVYAVTVEVSDGINPDVTDSFELSVTQTDTGTVLHRINAGGPEVVATDGGPNWAANPNPNTRPELVAGGEFVFGPSGTHSPITDVSDPSVPTSMPIDVFNTERWDSAAVPAMAWKFPVPAGTVVEVRIGQGEIYGPAGPRSYDLEIDGVLVETGITPNALGFGSGFVTDYVVTADADGLDIVFIHVADNPNPKSFEIIELVPVVNDPPTIDTPLADATTNETIPFSTDVVASDPEGQPLTYSFVGDVPPGMTIDAGTGQIDWTPGLADSGVHDIVVAVSDGVNPPVNDDMTLTVNQQAPPGAPIYRVNVGGAAVAAADGSFPDWEADNAATPSPYLVSSTVGGIYSTATATDLSHPTVSGTAPGSVYQIERYADVLTYAFPVPAGTEVEVRLLFNEIFQNAPGGRAFDIAIDGTTLVTGADPITAGGKFVASEFDAVITSDGVVDIVLTKTLDKAALKGIEILGVSGSPAVEFVDSLDGTTVTSNAVTVEWMFNGFNVAGIDHVHFQIDGGPALGANSGTVSGDHNTLYRPTTSIDLEDLADGVHTVTVTVADGGHVEYGNPEAFATATFTVDTAVAPSAPSGVSAVDGDGVVDLDWDDDPLADSYVVYRSETAGVTTADTPVGTPTSSSFSDTSVVNGTIYYYAVVATNTIGDSPISGEVSGYPLPDTAVIERINTGGALVAATDGPNQAWEADTLAANHPTLTVAGNNKTSVTDVNNRHPSLPSYVPAGVFDSERWAQNTTTGMTYAIPVTPGQTVDVRLFLSNNYGGSSGVGQREFNVTIEGVEELSAFGPVAAYGHLVGGMERFIVTDDGDGLITIQFTHTVPQADNPNVNAIEVRET